MRYLDGEVTPGEREQIEAEIERSTELKRELAVFQGMKNDLLGIHFRTQRRERSIWDRVNRQLTRPFGWVLLTVGASAWVLYGFYLYFSSPLDPWGKLATSAIVIGILLLLTSVVLERYREWLTDPYRDIQR